MTSDETHAGRCFCGAVQFEVSGEPAGGGLCHCESCRRWQAAPVNLWTLWPDAAVTITAGADLLHEFDVRGDAGTSGRSSCKKCGGAVLNRKRKIGMTVIYPTTLLGSGFAFEPQMHIYYEERAVDIGDGLPKFADLPEAFGGSGKQLEEPAATSFRVG